MIRPFSPFLWTGFLTSTLVFVLSIILTDKSPSKIRKYFYEAKETFDYNLIFIIIIGDGSSKLPSKSSTRLIVMSFILVCLVLRSVYTSAMYNFFRSGANHPTIVEFKELEERQYTFYVPYYFESYIPFDEIKINRK